MDYFFQDDLKRAKWESVVQPDLMQKIITSSYAIGAILSQLDEKQEQDFPVAYSSRTLNSTIQSLSFIVSD
jgi:hypothetical protein